MIAFSSIYYLACQRRGAVFIGFELGLRRRWRMPRVWFELWTIAALVVVVTLPVVLPYLEVSQRLGITRSIAEVVQ